MMFAGAGFQAEVIRHFQSNRRGPVFIGEYLKWGLHVATSYRLPRITVEVDGKVVARGGPWVEVFNISHYGGPLRLANHASPMDGLFDIMVFEGRRVRDIARLLSAAFASFTLRRPWRLREMSFLRGRRVRVRADDPVPMHMDGDFCGFVPIDVEILPGHVRLLAPPNGHP
jgi:diacylglycerol kinase family enzyme